jgi:CCR4-NOT transcription complex subunit 1
MGIMSILAEMHGTPDFKLNLKFEIEVLCKQLEIQLNVNEKFLLFENKTSSNF